TPGPSGTGTRKVLPVPSNLTLFVASVGGAGLLIATLALHGLDLQSFIAHVPLPGWLLVIGLILGELGPIPVARGDDEASNVTMSTTFAVALVATGPFDLLLVAHTAAVLMDDLRTKRSPIKMIFNFGQYALSLAAARLVFAQLTGQGFLASYTWYKASDLLPTLLAGFIFLVVNNGLVAIVVALASGQPVIEMLRDDLAFKMETSAVLVGLAGVAAVLAQTSGWMLPLLAMPVLAVRRSAMLAAARQTQAMRDALTGLGNRSLFFSRTDRLLARSARSGESVAVLMIDLDHFKDINDTLGHQIGDRVIQAVAGRIAHLGGELGCVGRLGGDEFAVALSGVDATAAGAVAETLLADVVRPLQIGGTRMAIQASVGIAMAEKGVDVTALMQRADIALYEAKQDRARWCLFDASVTPTTPELGLLADLREALENGELSVAFQPQVGLSDGRVTGAEALARWKHPERGYIPPSDFIILAENTGLISQVTDVVLEETLSALADWNREGLSCPVSVNLSARQLADLSLPQRVSSALRRHGVPAGLLTVEVTESSILGDPRRAGQILHELRQEGVRIAVDDFGTGYSSLAYLQRLDLDELKIDRSFVQSMCLVARDDVLVRSIIELAHNLGLSVVAEGVEASIQVDRLRELACDAAQGYYLGRPMDRDLMTGWLQRDALLGSRPQPGEAALVPLPEGRPHLRSVATKSGTDG
ncbi:MAG: EAL domain-containing protein, partial [Actinomycetota bacterium]|nr:EAL domain-containing protein [Actinomycetota bacterium]